MDRKNVLIICGIATIAVVAIVLPVTLVLTRNSPECEIVTTTVPTTTQNPIVPTKKPYDPSALSEQDKSRIDCFLEAESRFENLTKFQCEEVRGCIYSPLGYERVPDCFFNRTKLGYTAESINQEKEEYFLKKSPLVKSPYLEEIKNLKLTVEYLGQNLVHVKIIDVDDDTRYEVPYKLNQVPPGDKLQSKAKFEYSVDQDSKLFSFKIIRKSTNEAIFDTSMGAFVFNNQFLQISTKLPSRYIYGFGENNHENLAHDLNFRSWGMFARDNAPGWGDNRNNYGFQPVYYALENSTKSHMVLFYTSNAMGKYSTFFIIK